VQVTQRLPQHLRLLDVDRDEFEDAILSKYAHDHLALGLIVNIDERDASSTRLEHTPASFVECLERVDGDRLDWCDTKCTLNIAKAVQFELINLCESIRILPVVLYDVEVVGSCEKASVGRSLRVPQRCRHNP
jgi:hypothetical protein